MMNKRQSENFKECIRGWFAGLKSGIAPEYHDQLRRMIRKVVAEDEKEYKEFVALMTTPTATEKDQADELKDIEDGAVTHQCHYCGTMWHISGLTGAKEGLICDKCRTEMETQE